MLVVLGLCALCWPPTARALSPVSRILDTDVDLGETHRGYLHYVSAHPALANHERAWWRLLSDPASHTLAAQVVGAVQLEAYYDALARDPEGDDPLATALTAIIQLDPLRRRRLLEHVAEFAVAAGSTGGALGSSNARIQRTVTLGFLPEGTLRTMLEALLASDTAAGESPAAYSRLWQALGGSAAADAFREGLLLHLQARPDSALLWHERNRALAQDAHARTWIRHWHRVVARTPGLGAEYWQYLAELPDADIGQGSAVAHWPPKFAPPTTESDADAPPTPSRRPVSTATPEPPVRPEVRVQRPKAPVPPKPPARPGEVARPSMPLPPERPSAPAPQR